MPYLIVKGTFHIIGKQPDGDTIAFRPKNPEKWLKKAGMRIPVFTERCCSEFQRVFVQQSRRCNQNQQL